MAIRAPAAPLHDLAWIINQTLLFPIVGLGINGVWLVLPHVIVGFL